MGKVKADAEDLASERAAEMAVSRYGQEFEQLPKQTQYDLFQECWRSVLDDQITAAELLESEINF